MAMQASRTASTSAAQQETVQQEEDENCGPIPIAKLQVPVLLGYWYILVANVYVVWGLCCVKLFH